MKKKQKIKLYSKEIACGTADETWLHASSGIAGTQFHLFHSYFCGMQRLLRFVNSH